ncbi:MAG: 50S ribosome-binding GTPase, partial [Planctomycetota bacterium]|nr:50S ribosome-binding GTPase [Planctomycetota bacterium]
PPSSRPMMPDVGRLAYGHFVDAGGRPLDEIILYRAAETVFEVNCHGGPAAVEAVCRRLAGLGLERVDPDRLLALEGAGPIERDAERMLREARTPLAGRILLDQRNGALARAIDKILKALAAGLSAEAAGEIDALLERWQSCGRLLASPPRVAVAGPPNVGKSTLVNRLVGAERVLVSATPGTTRDYVEADAAIEGLPVVLVDTAGLRETEEHVEREGVARARRQVAGAAVVVYLLDAAEGARPEDEAALGALGARAVAAWNKADLAARLVRRPAGSPPSSLGACRSQRPASGAANQTALRVSALHGDGMDALGRAILARLGWRPPAAAGEAVPFTAAQAAVIERARDALATGDSAAAKERLESLAGGATSAG